MRKQTITLALKKFETTHNAENFSDASELTNLKKNSRRLYGAYGQEDTEKKADLMSGPNLWMSNLTYAMMTGRREFRD